MAKNRVKQELECELAIIGGGPAGVTAAVYAKRANVDVILFEGGAYGGQVNVTSEIENFPGFNIISGMELANKFEEQVKYNEVKTIRRHISSLNKDDEQDNFILETRKEIIKAKKVIFATGSNPKKLGTPGELELASRGVSYCAVCDGSFYKNEDVVVVGGGDSAVEEAVYLSNIVNKVYVIHRRDELRAKKSLQDALFKRDNIEVVWDHVVTSYNEGQDNKLAGVTLSNVKTNEVKEISAKGAFIYVGIIPTSQLLQDSNLSHVLTQDNWVKVDGNFETAQKGLFAVGDIIEKDLRQIVTACGEATEAAINAYKQLNEE